MPNPPQPTRPINLIGFLDICPPFLCYYGAHFMRDRRPTTNELIAASGLASRTFMRISRRTSWADVSIEQASKFARACGIDLLNPHPFRSFILEQVESGGLMAEFNRCGGAGDLMMANFNHLSSKAVLEREKHG